MSRRADLPSRLKRASDVPLERMSQDKDTPLLFWSASLNKKSSVEKISLIALKIDPLVRRGANDTKLRKRKEVGFRSSGLHSQPVQAKI